MPAEQVYKRRYDRPSPRRASLWGGTNDQIFVEQVCEAWRPTKSLPSKSASGANDQFRVEQVREVERMTKSPPIKSARQGERPNPRRADTQGRNPGRCYRARRPRQYATSPNHVRTIHTVPKGLWHTRWNTPACVQRYTLTNSWGSSTPVVGALTPDSLKWPACPKETQQIHHSGVYAYIRQRVMQAHDDRQSRATHDRTMGLTHGTHRALL
jgi:hypothetical protein